MILVDSNILLDIFTQDPVWYSWSSTTLMDLLDEHCLAINPIIYSEISIRFQNIEDLEKALPFDNFEFLPLSKEIAFLAGKCFLSYRKNGGLKKAPLPDFYIGAHATILKIPLLTRDLTLYRTYFPHLKLICPAKNICSN